MIESLTMSDSPPTFLFMNSCWHIFCLSVSSLVESLPSRAVMLPARSFMALRSSSRVSSGRFAALRSSSASLRMFLNLNARFSAILASWDVIACPGKFLARVLFRVSLLAISRRTLKSLRNEAESFM